MANPEEATIHDKVRGNFLLARLGVKGIFERSVVWISRFSRDEGAQGLILNAPMRRMLGECSPSFTGTPLARIPMHVGGPVGAAGLTLLACIRNPITGGRVVQLGLSPDRVRELAGDPAARLFAFAGTSGWAPRQLEDELASGTWLPVRADFDAWCESAEPDLWRRLAEKSRRLEARLMTRAPRNLSDN
ncbi:MAG: YqgE/AlgH family protein [Candidatus Spyradosoma sp.]